MAGPTHFVADAHLRCGEPDTWLAFFAYLQGPARDCEAIYLLGDIFNAWVGDDDNEQLACLARNHLSDLSRAGVKVYYILGNHDFLIGKRFAAQTGVRLLGTQTTVKINGQRVLLMHGDLLDTDNERYLRARQKMLRPWYLWFVRNIMPMKLRRQKAKLMLERTDPPHMVKVDEKYAAQLLVENKADLLVHGHTHRPMRHELEGGGARWAVPAWTSNSGGWLQFDADGWQLYEDYSP